MRIVNDRLRTYRQTYATSSVALALRCRDRKWKQKLRNGGGSICLRLWKLVFLQVLAVITCKINLAVLPFRISVVRSPQVAPHSKSYLSPFTRARMRPCRSSRRISFTLGMVASSRPSSAAAGETCRYAPSQKHCHQTMTFNKWKI